MKTIQDVLDAIWDGDLSVDELHTIRESAQEAIKDVAKREARKMAARLSPGDKVRIRKDANLRPKYLLGTEAEVLAVKQRNADILLGEVSKVGGRFRTGQRIGCPMEGLEKIE